MRGCMLAMLAVVLISGCGGRTVDPPSDPNDGVLTSAELPGTEDELTRHLGEHVDLVGTPAQGGGPLHEPDGLVAFYLVVGPEQLVVLVIGMIEQVKAGGEGSRIRVKGALSSVFNQSGLHIQASSVEFVR